MTALPGPTPSLVLEAIRTELKAKHQVFRETRILHGKFRIEDLDRISFRTPATFVSIAAGEPEIGHNGQIRMTCQFAIMLVTSTGGREDPWALATDVLGLIHRNMFGFRDIGQPLNPRIIPILSSSERSKNQALTAVTWDQAMTISKGPDRSRDLDEVLGNHDEVVWQHEDGEGV